MSDSRAQELLTAYVLREACSSVALSHDEACECLACRAASGDAQAFAWLAGTMAERPPTPPASS